ncbi:MAG: hypothetical protein ACTTHM_07760 [Peptoanaerobacter stomatis]|uniref:hypothetical protein n=1 Tax=Clostridia TaxID=186801 RepID=UPI003FA01565
METKSIEEKVINILELKLISFDKEVDYNVDLPLTGHPFLLTDVDMVYLLLEIEKEFDIHIEERDLLEYGFSTISQIVKVISTYII